MNDTDEIKEAFQPYYTTTILSEATNPNILHDLERDVRGFKFFSDFEVNGFVDELFAGATPDKLNHIIDEVIARITSENLTEEERAKFNHTLTINEIIKALREGSNGYFPQFLSVSFSYFLSQIASGTTCKDVHLSFSHDNEYFITSSRISVQN